MSKISGLSGLSPPASVNSSSFAILSARSVRVCFSKSIGSAAIFCKRASLVSYWLKLNTKLALLLNVIKAKWSVSGEGLNASTSFFKNSIAFFRFFLPTLVDLSRMIPMSSPAVQGGAVEIKVMVIVVRAVTERMNE